MILLGIVGCLRYVYISCDIWLNILRYPVRYLIKSAISQDIKNISSYFRYVKISQNWTYPKITEISHIFPDILDILGYLDLFSDISGVQPLRWCFTIK